MEMWRPPNGNKIPLLVAVSPCLNTAVGTEGTEGQYPPPKKKKNSKPKIQEYEKQRHINHCIEIRLKYAHRSANIENHRYTK